MAPVAQRLVQHLVAIRCVGHGIYMRPYSFACPLTYRALAGAANLVEMPGNSICAGAHVHSTSRMRHLSRRVCSSPIPHNWVWTVMDLRPNGLERHLYHSNETHTLRCDTRRWVLLSAGSRAGTGRFGLPYARVVTSARGRHLLQTDRASDVPRAEVPMHYSTITQHRSWIIMIEHVLQYKIQLCVAGVGGRRCVQKSRS